MYSLDMYNICIYMLREEVRIVNSEVLLQVVNFHYVF